MRISAGNPSNRRAASLCNTLTAQSCEFPSRTPLSLPFVTGSLVQKLTSMINLTAADQSIYLIFGTKGNVCFPHILVETCHWKNKCRCSSPPARVEPASVGSDGRAANNPSNTALPSPTHHRLFNACKDWHPNRKSIHPGGCARACLH